MIPALKTGARVVIIDEIVPEPSVLGKLDERRIMGYYMIMKTLFNSKEWSETECRGYSVRLKKRGDLRFVGFL